MKLTILLILISVFGSFALDGYSQVTKLTLEAENNTIKEILNKIEKQSEFRFFYSSNVDVEQEKSISKKGKKIFNILDELFEGTDIKYEVYGRQIALLTGNDKFIAPFQDKTVSGKVTDSSGSPLPGVTVVVKGTTQGTVTDADGSYTIANVSEDAILVFSFVGMKTQEIYVNNQVSINVILTKDVQGLEEVVAIGYGTQKKANVIGSISTVRNNEIESQPVSGISNMLAGRLPGGVFTQESGLPGKDDAIIRIRGNATLGNNSPLIVVDGIVERNMNSLDPNDIESITVLKDASAAIYGASAANGVILVTTKRGTMDMSPTVTYSFYEGFSSPTMLVELADAATYATMIREYQTYQGTDESNMRYSLDDIAKYKSGEYPWTHPNVDWYEEVLKDYSSIRRHNLSIKGGSKSISYYTSFGYSFVDGIYTNNATNVNKYNLKANLDFKLNEYLNIGLDLTGIKDNRMYSPTSEYETFFILTKMWPTSHALWPGTDLPGPDYERGLQPMVITSSKVGFDDDKYTTANTTFSADLKIPWIKGLNLSGIYAYDITTRRRKVFVKPWFIYSMDEPAYFAAGNTGKEDGSDFLIRTQVGISDPELTESFRNTDRKMMNIKLSYKNTFKEVHNIKAFVAYEQSEYFTENFSAYRRFFLSDRLPYLFAGGDEQKDNGALVGIDARRNYFGRISYDYKNKYLFQFSFRRDGSLRFSEESGRWGNFPSVLLGWRMSNEDWWQKSLSFIDYFKLRASWGQMGNDRIAPFQYLNTYEFTQGLPFGEDKIYELGLIRSTTPNPLITWEVANTFNLGWESILFDSKISMNADFFYERRNNILIQRDVSVPNFVGIDLPDENFGIVDNKGFELILGYNNKYGDFMYSFEGNFAFVRNEIIESDEPERPVPWQVRTGKPQGAELLYKAIGIFDDWEEVESTPHVIGAEPGDIIIEDYDGDGEITGKDRQLFTLTTTPEITFGLNFNFSYRNWELSGLFQGHGRALRRINPSIQQGMAGNYFMYDAIDRWTPDNPDGSKPKAFNWNEEYWRSTHITDYFYHNMSFVRLKNLRLSYTIPHSALESISVLKDARVYISGQNLWLVWAAQHIQDPELRHGMGAYPIMKVMAVGAQISF